MGAIESQIPLAWIRLLKSLLSIYFLIYYRAGCMLNIEELLPGSLTRNLHDNKL